MKRVRSILLMYLIPIFLVLQILISLTYYILLHDTFVEINKTEPIYLTNISYAILPLFPVSFTLFWNISTLHGTVTLLKSLKCLKKLLLNTTLNSEKAERKKSKKSKYAKYLKKNSEDLGTETNECLIMNHSTNNLSHDDLSQINELSSIESLIAAMPIPQEDLTTEKQNCLSQYFFKVNKKIRFYFQTINLILFNKPSLNADGHTENDLDVQNASFIYYSNFLIGLGIITVSDLL